MPSPRAESPRNSQQVPGETRPRERANSQCECESWPGHLSGNIGSMSQETDRIVVGLISDTHGLLRPSVHAALQGVSLILHAGDVGGQEILDELSIIAPVHAVFGNTDTAGDPSLTETIVMTIGGIDIRVVHGHELGSPTPAKLMHAYSERVIIYGHTHKQLVTRVREQLVVNPGAAGPRRFNLEPSVARLTIEQGRPEVEIVALD